MANVSREELLFTQLIIRSGLISLDQYQEILEIRANIEQKVGIRKAIDEIVISKGYLDQKVVENLRQKIRMPASPSPSDRHSELTSIFSEDILDNPPVPTGYRLAEKLGEGAMGAVYKAYRSADSREAAIKFLDPRYNNDKEFVHRFMREARTVSTLAHPNIVRALGFGEQSGVYYFAMEYVRGQSLATLLESRGRFSQSQAVNITLQIARALQYAHKNGFIHRDIKPENILVDENENAKLCDFGLIRGNERETLVTQVGAFVGTPQYVSPEQARGQENIDGRADIYSLGCTFYQMVTGQPPYAHNNPIVVLTWQATKPFPDPLKASPDLSPRLAAIIRKMTAKDRELRLANMDTLVQKLENYDRPDSKEQEAVPKKSVKTQKRSRNFAKTDKPKNRQTVRRRKYKETSAIKGRNLGKTRENKLRESGVRKRDGDKKNMMWGLILWMAITLAIMFVLLWQIFK